MLSVHCSNFGGRISRFASGRTHTKTDTKASLHPEALRTRFSSPSQLPRRAVKPAYPFLPLLSLTHKSTSTTRHCLLRWVIRRYTVISQAQAATKIFISNFHLLKVPNFCLINISKICSLIFTNTVFDHDIINNLILVKEFFSYLLFKGMKTRQFTKY